MRVTYIHHSAFLAETENASLLFDYFQGKLPQIPADKPLYLFASHRHPDHFSESVFDVAAGHSDARLVLSYDIWKKRVPKELLKRTVFLEPGGVYEDAHIKAEAFCSTDEGVAFWVSTGEKQLYHAGDLNHWYWEGEDEKWNTDMTAAYRREIQKMAGRTADAAFLALDPRLERHFYLGIDDFMKTADAKAVFPMHFWGEYDVARRLKELPCSAAYRDRIVEIEREGQSFLL